MRKQTKIVAVASAAALLAIGASMTSFAAYGWVQEDDGTWYFYDRDDNRVEDEWKRSGDNWYWLDSEEGGAMAVDKLIEDDDDTYYVDSNGVMVRNTWVKVVNEDQDDDTDPAEYNYYYMQSNGKAYKNTGSTTTFKTIDGKRYAFDDEGKMLYGWVNDTVERVTDEDEWANPNTCYYLGNWDDGAMKTGWQKIYVHDSEKDDDVEYWFSFKSNGKKRTLTESDAGKEYSVVNINGQKYGFDERGVMVYQWTRISETSGSDASTANWKYFNDPENGARVTKGWFKVIAPADDNDNTFKDYDVDGFAKTDADDETERWYYAGVDGVLAKGEIKKIKGKYYGFRPEGDGKSGAMLTGLVLLKTNGYQIQEVVDDGVDSDELTAILNGTYSSEYEKDDTDATLFYFGGADDGDTDGAMRTGTTTINVDGDSYQFLFSKTGGAEGKGRGFTGIDDKKYVYVKGCKIKADSDEKYVVARVYETTEDGKKKVEAYKVDLALTNARDAATSIGYNKDGDDVRLVEFGNAAEGTAWSKEYYLVNTSGSIVKTKAAAKDGNDWYFYVDKQNIKMYVNNKALKNGNTSEGKGNLNETTLNNWKNWAPKATANN